MKKCKACGLSKKESEFHSKSNRADGLSPDCKPCANSKRTKRRKSSPWDLEKRREYTRKYLYGLTPERYQEMYEIQNGLCAICVESPIYAVDHDHKTGEVRGLLCRECNLGLGFFKDRIDFLHRAADYIRP